MSSGVNSENGDPGEPLKRMPNSSGNIPLINGAPGAGREEQGPVVKVPKLLQPLYDDIWNKHFTAAASTLRPPYAAPRVGPLLDMYATLIPFNVLTRESPGFADTQATIYQYMKKGGSKDPRFLTFPIVRGNGEINCYLYDLSHIIFLVRNHEAFTAPVCLDAYTGRRIASQLLYENPVREYRPQSTEYFLHAGTAEAAMCQFVKELTHIAWSEFGDPPGPQSR